VCLVVFLSALRLYVYVCVCVRAYLHSRAFVLCVNVRVHVCARVLCGVFACMCVFVCMFVCYNSAP